MRVGSGRICRRIAVEGVTCWRHQGTSGRGCESPRGLAVDDEAASQIEDSRISIVIGPCLLGIGQAKGGPENRV